METVSICLFGKRLFEYWRRLYLLKKKRMLQSVKKKHRNASWLWTIRGAMMLWKELEKNNFENFNLQFINQDQLENFFSRIRDVGHRNNNPTPSDFAAAYKTNLITNLTFKHSSSTNCEETTNGTPIPLSKLFDASQVEAENNEIECSESNIEEIEECPIILTNVANIIHKMSKKLKCTNCMQQLSDNSIARNLQISLAAVEKKMPNLCYKVNIKKEIMKIIKSDVTLEMHCAIVAENIVEKIAEIFLLQ